MDRVIVPFLHRGVLIVYYGSLAEGGTVTKENIIAAIRAASAGNRLTCEKAHELAKELKVSLREIGALCNEMKIKISSCQLGCF